MLTADGEKSKSTKRAKVRFLLATLTHKFGKSQNSYEYVHQLMRPTVVPGVDCEGTV